MEGASIDPKKTGEPAPGAEVFFPSHLPESFSRFSVFGGPVHEVLYRLRGAREGASITRFGIALGLGLWLVLVALAALEGILDHIVSWQLVAAHVRLLIAIPLLFVCESYVAPRMATFVRYLVESGVVRGEAVAKLERRASTVIRLRTSSIPFAACLVIAIAVTVSGAPLVLPGGVTDLFDPSRPEALTLANTWYWFVCLTVFRFLILRWVWALGLWVYFLVCVSRLELTLVPTHPDGAGGLGYLEVVHTEFSFLVFAISSVYAASFAESVLSGEMTLTTLYPALCFVGVGIFVLFVAPLFVFSRMLWEAQADGMARYMHFASGYVEDFERKWIQQRDRHREELLGTPDLQSLADLGNSVDVVKEMSLIPATRRLFLSLGVAALAPMLPVALMLLPGDDIAAKLFKLLLGGE